MKPKEFIAYVNEQKRIGLDDGQIARNLGMDPGVFPGALKFAYEKVAEDEATYTYTPPVIEETIEEKPKAPRKPRKKAEVFEVPQSE